MLGSWHSLPPPLKAGFIFYLPVFVAACVLAPRLALPMPFLERMAGRLRPWMGISVLTIIFMLTGLYWTFTGGAHSGDEGHYLIQAESLHAEGDLDIRNNLENEMGSETVAQLGRYIFHVSPFSRGNHWHSFHPAGLPILLAPLVPGGAAARHFLLGLITALTAFGAWRLCRRAGGTATASALAIAGFFGSLYGVVYASRCLPEMLGACLLVWLCWSVLAQADFPWRSAFLGGLSCAYLPWAHLRFYPLALLGILFYGMFCAGTPEYPARKIRRIIIFLFISIGGILFHKHIQNLMYEGGSAYAVSDVLFSHTEGLWHVFTDDVGLLNVFPLAAGLIAANIILTFVAQKSGRRMAIVFGGMFGTAWLTSCGGGNYGGGAALGGRFLLAVMPLLLPAAAALWHRISGPARWWLLLLALVSIALCLMELICLPKLGRSFAFPYRELPLVAPLLSGLPTPFCGTAHAAVIGILTLCLLAVRRNLPAAVLAGLAVAATLIWQIAVRI